MGSGLHAVSLAPDARRSQNDRGPRANAGASGCYLLKRGARARSVSQTTLTVVVGAIAYLSAALVLSVNDALASFGSVVQVLPVAASV